jgi:hypothetical protein
VRRAESGVGLVEALLALMLIAALSVAATELFGSMLRSDRVSRAEVTLAPEAQRVLRRLSDAVRTTSLVAMPNGRVRVASMLVVAAGIDNDGDGRVDEDPGAAMIPTSIGVPGVDDDGDSMVDEAVPGNDDEDSLVNEDPRNGVDDDGDGSIDEDPGADANGDGAPGIVAVDDDHDGLVDEGDPQDDDEDGLINEDGVELRTFAYDSPTRTLRQTEPDGSSFTLLDQVQAFTVTYVTGGGGQPLVEIMIRLQAAPDAVPLVLTTRVYPTNLEARHGRTLP